MERTLEREPPGVEGGVPKGLYVLWEGDVFLEGGVSYWRGGYSLRRDILSEGVFSY